MKLLVITSIKEYQKTVAQILQKSNIAVFSLTETAGFKEHHTTNRPDNWFGGGSEQFDSIVVFSFTDDTNAETAIQHIRQHNAAGDGSFPIRGFVMPVEMSSNF